MSDEERFRKAIRESLLTAAGVSYAVRLEDCTHEMADVIKADCTDCGMTGIDLFMLRLRNAREPAPPR